MTQLERVYGRIESLNGGIFISDQNAWVYLGICLVYAGVYLFKIEIFQQVWYLVYSVDQYFDSIDRILLVNNLRFLWNNWEAIIG